MLIERQPKRQADVRRQGNAQAQEAVDAHLEQHAGQVHGAGGRRLDVGQRQPGVQRHQRHLDREARHQEQEHHQLHSVPAHIVQDRLAVHQRHQAGNREGQLPRLLRRMLVAKLHDPQHAEQGQHAPGQRVEEELARRQPAMRPAPDADQEEQRHQRDLEKHVKQQDVEGEEDAHHGGLQRQQPAIKLIDALGDVRPGHQDRRQHQHRRQHDHPDVKAVDAEIELHRALAEVDQVPARPVRVARCRAGHERGREGGHVAAAGTNG